ncbi:hypothetical protein [Novosphingobium beihaiensis]|uniref:hypothetical protein n=1 Tax=Novosphingobium beihaiensis TaxID=2930389 RepID=UPI001FB93BC5|nr:hypothetical protein [Novosphingobium beihaiensis]
MAAPIHRSTKADVGSPRQRLRFGDVWTACTFVRGCLSILERLQIFNKFRKLAGGYTQIFGYEAAASVEAVAEIRPRCDMGAIWKL